jgi:hypothetical protein
LADKSKWFNSTFGKVQSNATPETSLRQLMKSRKVPLERLYLSTLFSDKLVAEALVEIKLKNPKIKMPFR